MSNKYNAWDWVVTKSGQIRQITHDDMNDLHYEDILRKATPAEVGPHRLSMLTPMTNQDKVFDVMKTINDWKPGHNITLEEQVAIVETLGQVWESMDSVTVSVGISQPGHCPHCNNSPNTFGNNCNERCLNIRNHK